MVTNEHLTAARVEALLKMIAESGESPPGQLPPQDRVSALFEADNPRAARDEATAHREGGK